MRISRRRIVNYVTVQRRNYVKNDKNARRCDLAEIHFCMHSLVSATLSRTEQTAEVVAKQKDS